MVISISGIRINEHPFSKVVELITNHISSSKVPAYVVTPNAHHIFTLQDDAYFRKVYDKAFLSVPDGVSLLWAAKFLGTPLNGRVNGTDLFECLCETSAKQGLKVFFLGGRPGAAQAAAEILRERYPQLNIVGTHCPPYGFEAQDSELQLINKKVKISSPDILFVGLGAPKQEKWIYENYQQLGVPISIGIGVSFELISGVVHRAPKLMQKLGLEWFFRLFMEPRRLWKRYFISNFAFTFLVIKQKFQ